MTPLTKNGPPAIQEPNTNNEKILQFNPEFTYVYEDLTQIIYQVFIDKRNEEN